LKVQPHQNQTTLFRREENTQKSARGQNLHHGRSIHASHVRDRREIEQPELRCLCRKVVWYHTGTVIDKNAAGKDKDLSNPQKPKQMLIRIMVLPLRRVVLLQIQKSHGAADPWVAASDMVSSSEAQISVDECQI